MVTGNSDLKPAGYGESFSMADIEKLKQVVAAQQAKSAATAADDEDNDLPDLTSAGGVDFEQVATK
jgi:hypothetical protein